MNHEIKAATYARRTMIAAAVMALFAAGANAQYAHSPDTDLTPINGNLPKGALPFSWDNLQRVPRHRPQVLSQLGRQPPDEGARVLAYCRSAPRPPRHRARGG